MLNWWNGKRMKYLLLIIFLSSIFLNAQDTAKISAKRNEFDKIKAEIKSLESELKAKTQSEKKSVKAIENLNRQNLLLNKVITTLKTEEQNRVVKISGLETDITKVTAEISSLKKSYSKYLVYLYKYGRDSELMSIANSKSFNEALVKYKYFSKISGRRKQELNKLKEDKFKLDLLHSELVQENIEKKLITGQKQKEEENLQAKLSEKKEILKDLKSDKASLSEEIELKKKASVEIKNIITQLIIVERKKTEELKKKRELAGQKKLAELKKLSEQKKLADQKKAEEEKIISGKTTEMPPNQVIVVKAKEEKTPVETEIETMPVGSSLIRKGSLLWPVDNGSVFKKFGETRNPKLNTVTINTGIDIKTGNSSNVKSVASGTVSVIEWVPGYGSVLIVTHTNGFRSVYGHLSEIFVTEGEKIQAGAPLGKVGESLEGNILHFELWIERANQNPEAWLARK